MTAPLPYRLPSLAVASERAPEVPLAALDVLWFQLTGTICNIACQHCFISCGPREERVPMMSTAAVRRGLADALRLGVKEYYFTGGEPMLHPDFWSLVEETLRQGPLTVLTNGMLLDEPAALRAREAFEGARYSFDLRVSLDGMTPEENDPLRGRGTFDAITAGIARLARAGISPAITVVEHRVGMAGAPERAAFLDFARQLGLAQPRVKFLPLLRIGREPHRTRGYLAEEATALRDQPLAPEITDRLGCASGRLLSADGVMTCPILLDAPGARLGAQLDQGLGPIRLRWSACRTCVVEGLSCRT